jgi:hypothetical protein
MYKKTFFLLLSILIFNYDKTNAQVIVPDDYQCLYSEIPGRGWGLTNGKITFYIDAKSRDLYTEEDEVKFLKKFTKTKDNLYYRNNMSNSNVYYEIVIPEFMFLISIASEKNNKEFQQYSVLLLNAVRNLRKDDSRIFFKRKTKKGCPINFNN